MTKEPDLFNATCSIRAYIKKYGFGMMVGPDQIIIHARHSSKMFEYGKCEINRCELKPFPWRVKIPLNYPTKKWREDNKILPRENSGEYIT